MPPKMPNLTILPAEPDDLPEVHRMLIALAVHLGDVATITPAGLAQATLEDPQARLIVACLADSPARHPVGYALLMRRQNLVTGKESYVIEQLYVQPPFRRAGIGRALMAGARDLVRAEGRAGLVIGAPPANAGAAAACRAMGLTELPSAGPSFAVALAS